MQKKDSLKKDIDKLDEEYIKTKKKTDELGVERNNIEKEIESAKSELLTISDKKNDVINDIKIKAGLGLFNVEKQESGYSFCYPLEHFNQDQKSIEIGSITDMENPVAHLLQNRVLIVDDIGDGVIFALQLGNVIYQLCQPSPKWISFHDFWTESLRPIWESAHQNPNIWHVLLIENFNIALPECWGKPLWNILSGMTTLLPCAKHPTLPDNLRIIVSEAATESDDNSHLGLPTKVGKKWTRIKNGHVE